jgi:hypothetical protein
MAKKKTMSKKRAKRLAWTKADISQLRKHSKARSSAKVVAKALNRSIGATYQMAMKNGLPLGNRRRKKHARV